MLRVSVRGHRESTVTVRCFLNVIFINLGGENTLKLRILVLRNKEFFGHTRQLT